MYKFTVESPYKQDKSRNINRYDSFHRALAPILTFVQIGGFMPVCGITANDLNEVVYKVKSFRFVYAVFTFGSMLFESFSALFTMGKIKLGNIDVVFYRLSSMHATYQFFFLAKRWPEFIRTWTSLEQVFLGKMYKLPGWTLKAKLAFVSCLVFIPALGEFKSYLELLLLFNS